MANIILAEPHGFCFGINRAIELTKDTAKKYSDKQIYFFGELVHNQHVVDWLENSLNIKTVHSLKEVPPKSVVIIRAHGASPQVYQQAKNRKLEVIDATCPLVLKSHLAIKKIVSRNKKVLFLCNKIDHDETVGVVGEAPEFITPVTLENISSFSVKDPKNTVVLTQTTLSTLETKKSLAFLKRNYPQITILPHICQATTERQNAIIKLAKKYKFVIIVGSPASANSNSLKSVAQNVGAVSYIIDNESELDPKWFIGNKNIVVSSGASTPQNVLHKVLNRIKKITHH